ncbi:MAG: alpha/beta fold hydrolase [Acidobacteriota bacterium]
MNRWLMLHGFAGGSETWDEVRRLAGLGAALAPRLAGHELDGEPPALGNSFDAEVQRLAGLCEAPVSVCGYSLGGRLALGLASSHPELVERLVLIGANPGLRSTEAREERGQADERWARTLEEEGTDEFYKRWLEQPLFASQRRFEAGRLATQDALRTRLTARGLSRAMRQMSLAAMPSFWEQLEALDFRVDLVVGGEDAKFGQLARAMAEHLPQAFLHVVDGVGHNVVLEAPEAVAGILTGDVR